MSAEQVKIRPATLKDAAAMQALEEQVFPEDPWSLESFEEELTPEYRKYFVAEDAQRLVGYAGVNLFPDVCDIMTIAVAEEYRGRGLGKKFLEMLMKLAAPYEREGANLLLEVRDDNPNAKALYAKYGFEQIERRKNYYPGKVDAIIMMHQKEDV